MYWIVLISIHLERLGKLEEIWDATNMAHDNVSVVQHPPNMPRVLSPHMLSMAKLPSYTGAFLVIVQTVTHSMPQGNHRTTWSRLVYIFYIPKDVMIGGL